VGAAEALGGALHDDIEHTVGVIIQLVVPNPQDRPSLARKKRIPPNIPVALRVLATIQLDNQSRLPASEVGDVRSDRQLPRELRPQP
jgi:hypothetical protein